VTMRSQSSLIVVRRDWAFFSRSIGAPDPPVSSRINDPPYYGLSPKEPTDIEVLYNINGVPFTAVRVGSGASTCEARRFHVKIFDHEQLLSLSCRFCDLGLKSACGLMVAWKTQITAPMTTTAAMMTAPQSSFASPNVLRLGAASLMLRRWASTAKVIVCPRFPIPCSLKNGQDGPPFQIGRVSVSPGSGARLLTRTRRRRFSRLSTPPGALR
jgi:hypothetical protein